LGINGETIEKTGRSKPLPPKGVRPRRRFRQPFSRCTSSRIGRHCGGEYMTNIRRHFEPGQICFLTHVTFNREPLLITHFDLLWQAIETYRLDCGFDLVAWVVLPNHMHLLIAPNDNDVSLLMSRIKLSFSAQVRRKLGLPDGRVWQYRFWDRIMRDQNDTNTHIDYIHYNPVKHECVTDPFAWTYSSLAEYHARGLYARDWGVKETLEFEGEFGE
jgi:putative transposase